MKKLWTFVNIILGIGYGIFLGIMVINAIIFNETLTIEKKLLFLILILIMFFLSNYLCTIIHESGHLIFGLISGFRFISFRIGSTIFLKDQKSNKIKKKKYFMAGTGGQCILYTPKDEAKKPFVLYNLGGVFLNLIFAVINGVIYIFVKELIIGYFFLFMMLQNILMIILNGIPLRSNYIDNDGYNTKQISKSNLAKEAFYAQIKITKATTNNIRLKDMDESFFLFDQELTEKNSMVSTIKLFRIERLIDEHKYLEAIEDLKLLLNDDTLAGIYQNTVKSDLIFCYLVTNNKELAEKYIDKGFKNMLKMKMPVPNMIRYKYTYYLLLENDVEKASAERTYLAQIEEKYPYKADFEGELEQINVAKEVYLANQNGLQM